MKDDSLYLPRLAELYDWFRMEWQNDEMIACGGIFPPEEIKAGQRWQGSRGHTVLVDKVDSFSVYYSWDEEGVKKTHKKSHFAFQCRYCLILS